MTYEYGVNIMDGLCVPDDGGRSKWIEASGNDVSGIDLEVASNHRV